MEEDRRGARRLAREVLLDHPKQLVPHRRGVVELEPELERLETQVAGLVRLSGPLEDLRKLHEKLRIVGPDVEGRAQILDPLRVLGSRAREVMEEAHGRGDRLGCEEPGQERAHALAILGRGQLVSHDLERLQRGGPLSQRSLEESRKQQQIPALLRLRLLLQRAQGGLCLRRVDEPPGQRLGLGPPRLSQADGRLLALCGAQVVTKISIHIVHSLQS